MTDSSIPAPQLSVVIPARTCKVDLRECLDSLARSEFRDFEVIVVDDASPDDTTADIPAAEARVLVLPAQSGPAGARNAGARVARGRYLLFLDADVCVHPDTLGRVVRTFAEDPDLTAVFGSYDTQPYAQNILSQYRNLMHHFVHQEAYAEATTFWAGCGAIRRDVFLAAGGFHPNFRRPCIEDIELGVRLHKAGHRLRLDKHILVTHRKCWTLWKMLRTDVRDRAMPWSQLILREGKMPNDLNLGLAHRVSALLACGLFLTLLAAIWYQQAVLALPVVAIAGIAALDRWSLARRVPTSWRLSAVLVVLAVTGLAAVYFKALVLIPLGLLAGIVVLNWRFYAFLARARHPLFAALAVPLHILYYLYSIAGLALACGLHVVRGGAAPSWPSPALQSDVDTEFRPDDAARADPQARVLQTLARDG